MSDRYRAGRQIGLVLAWSLSLGAVAAGTSWASSKISILWNDYPCTHGQYRCIDVYNASEVDAKLAAQKQSDDAQIATLKQESVKLRADLESLRSQMLKLAPSGSTR
jgi:hypothetical protein